MNDDVRRYVLEEVKLARTERRLRALGITVPGGALKPLGILPPGWAPIIGRPAPTTLCRSFDAAEVSASGRRLEIFCAPYRRPTRVIDPPPHGDGKAYVEELLEGVFAEACADPLSVELDRRHEAATIGHAETLLERTDGLHGVFTLTGKRRDVSRIVADVRSGVLGSASVEFLPIANRRTDTGVLQRVKAELSRVALCPRGAYAEAKVLAARSAVL